MQNMKDQQTGILRIRGLGQVWPCILGIFPTWRLLPIVIRRLGISHVLGMFPMLGDSFEFLKNLQF
jgi:hypothetical protein